MDFIESSENDNSNFFLYCPTFKSLEGPSKTNQLLEGGADLNMEYKWWAPNQNKINHKLHGIWKYKFVNLFICVWHEYYYSIPCEYPRKNMSIKVDKSSNYPNYLVVEFLYQGGQIDIIGIEVSQVSNHGSSLSTWLIFYSNNHNK